MAIVIHDSPRWRVTFYGNGIAYLLQCKQPDGRTDSIHFQGDAAAAFERECLDAPQPELRFADYADALQPDFV